MWSLNREFRPFFKYFLFTYSILYSESPINNNHLKFLIFVLLHFFQKLWCVEVVRNGPLEGQNALSLTIEPTARKPDIF